jgi:acyl carrier protein
MERNKTVDDDIGFIVKDIMMYKLGLEEDQLTDGCDVQYDLGIDSLDMIELQMELEKKFGINISSEEGEKLRTIKNITEFIKNKK